MDIEQAIQSNRELTQSLADALAAAGPVGPFELEPDYIESRDPCGSDLSTWQTWTPSLYATALDPDGDAFWPTTWAAARQAAQEAGFGDFVVLDDRPGNHAVEFSDRSGALILLMARPAAEDDSLTRTSIKLRTACHPEADGGAVPS